MCTLGAGVPLKSMKPAKFIEPMEHAKAPELTKTMKSAKFVGPTRRISSAEREPARSMCCACREIEKVDYLIKGSFSELTKLLNHRRIAELE